MYHGVVEKIRDPYLDRWCITKHQFQEQIAFLEKRFHFITLSELLFILQNKERTKKPCAVITFDDAFENVFSTAYPFLLKRKIPFVVAIPAGLINTRRSIWSLEIDLIALRSHRSWLSVLTNEGNQPLKFYLKTREDRIAAAVELRHLALSFNSLTCYQFVKRLIKMNGEEEFYELLDDYPHLKIMTVQQVNEMTNDRLELACHGFYHIPLSTENEDIITQEVCTSKIKLSELFGLNEIKHYILAHGVYNEKTKNTIQQAGYASCLTMKSRRIPLNEDVYQLPRVNGSVAMKDLVWALGR